MPNWFQSIFGGSSAQSNNMNYSTSTSGSSSNNQSQSQSGPSQQLNPFTAMLTPQIAGLAGSGVPQYGGPLAAPITGNEGNVLAQLMASTGPNSPNTGYLSSVLSGNYLPGANSGNPFLSGAITAAQRTTMDNLTDTLSRTLPGRFTAAGQFTQPQGSSAFDMAAAVASRGAANAMADIASTMGSNAYTAERNNQQQAVQLQQGEVQNTIANLQAQALPRLISQMGISNGLQVFQNNVTSVLQLLATLGQIGAPQFGNVSESTSSGSSSQTSGQVSYGNGSSTTTSTPGILPDLSAAKSAMSGTPKVTIG